MYYRCKLGSVFIILSVFVSTNLLQAQSRNDPNERIRQKRAVKSLEGVPNEVLDSYGPSSFGFSLDESTLAEKEKKKLERYRKLQRKLGFERAGPGVNVEAGYKAAAER